MGKIEIMGLGAGDLEQLPYGVYSRLLAADFVHLRTKEHPVVENLKAAGVQFESFDDIYESKDNFDDVYRQIADQLLDKAKTQDLIYAVPGHPLVAEDSVKHLLENEAGIEVEIVGGKSFIDDFFQAVAIDPIEGFQLLDGLTFHQDQLSLGNHLIIMQVFNEFVASDVKLKLMEKYPDEHQVALVDAAGTKMQKVTWCPLYEMDRLEGVHNLLSLYVPPLEKDERTKSFELTQTYMDAIVEKDVWVQSQTHESLLPYLKEECEEVAEAIQNDDIDNLIEELGDILLQVFYHASFGEREGFFTMEDILETLNKKLRRRHPHVFDGVKADTIEEIDKMWQAIKAKEKGNSDETR
ncbi:MAG: MazG nucleotide pyrophosphohydrolase domain-containing protein [Trichococcus sp.]|uniref:MazG nucleotide pyrophosphohydrolase domain-containing protein n=1 Tax=Trichococcus shcherbakoviae TaxID=2094020 RepID=UPI0029F5014B|nr:MazG nucleotide pyrophosphohydrolase domain-containing protein [Trichococcus shcherbakoviae]